MPREENIVRYKRCNNLVWIMAHARHTVAAAAAAIAAADEYLWRTRLHTCDVCVCVLLGAFTNRQNNSILHIRRL